MLQQCQMGGSASVVPTSTFLPSEGLRDLHGFNLAVAQGSLNPLKDLVDDDYQQLVQAVIEDEYEGYCNKNILIEEIDIIQTHLNKLRQALIDTPSIDPSARDKAYKSQTTSIDHHTRQQIQPPPVVEPEEIDDGRLINQGTDGKMYPFAVSLEFFLHFIKEHPETKNMTTAEVVYKIIIPETKDSQLTYVEAKLVGKYPQYFRVMERSCKHHANHPEQVSFLSHAWLMPFRTVIDIAISSMRPVFTSVGYVPQISEYANKCFFWMDVFCKNQHIPAPAMDEFETAMKLSQQVVLVLYPIAQIKVPYSSNQAQNKAVKEQLLQDARDGKIPQPIVLSRIWCLFEVMTCLKMKKALMPAVADNQLELLHSDLFIVDVSKAQATVPADIELILGLVKSSIGIDEMNKQVKEAIISTLSYQNASLEPIACFDGDGWVYVPGTLTNNFSYDNMSKRLVKDLRGGDQVLTCLNPSAIRSNNSLNLSMILLYPSLFEWATVSLVTKDDVSSFHQKQLPENVSTSLWNVHGLTITSEHPVWDSQQGKWVKARECKGAVRSHKTLNYVYNIELVMKGEEYHDGGRVHGLDRYGNVLVNDVMVMTLGHGYDFDVETDKLYGYGWYDNPTRKKYMEL